MLSTLSLSPQNRIPTASRGPWQLPNCELPPKPQIFFGRDGEVELLVQALVDYSATHLAILGPGGMGKTTTATAVLHNEAVVRKFSSRRIFISCEGITSAHGILMAIAKILKLADHEDCRQAVLRLVSSISLPILLFLDNLESAWDSEDQPAVEEMLAELANIRHLSLMVTMRGTVRPSQVDWTHPVSQALQPLALDAARQIFVTISRRVDPTRDVDKLLALLDGLPLAITLMAFQGQVSTAQELMKAYDNEKTQLLRRGRNRRLTSVEVSIEVSLNCMTMQQHPEALELLGLLCLLPEGMGIRKMADAVPSLERPGEAARTLEQVALASGHRDRLRILSPIRDFILMSKPPNGRHLDELRDYFMGLCSRADNVGTATGKQNAEFLSIELGNITSVLVHFWKALPDGDNIPRLFSATRQAAHFSSMCSRGDPTTLLAEAQRRLDVMQYRHEAAECRRRLGDVLHSHCRYAEAITMLGEAKLGFGAADRPLGAAQCTLRLGNVLRMQSRYTEAVPMLEEAKLAFEAIGEPQGAAHCTQSLGDVLRMQCRYTEAVPTLEEAKLAFEAIGDALGAAQCTESLGEVLRMQSRYTEAVPMLEEAKLAFEAIGQPLGVAQCTQILGDCTHRLGDVLYEQSRYPEAVAMLEEAKFAFEAIGQPLGAAQCTLRLGNVLNMQSRYTEAVALLEEARLAFKAIDEPLGAAQCTLRLGNVLRMQYRYPEAVAMLEEAKLAFEAVGQPLGVAQCTQRLGNVLHMQSRFTEAVAMLEEAKLAFEAIGDPLGAAQCTQSLGEVLRMQSRYTEAVPMLEEAKLAFEAIGEPHGAAQCTQSLGNVLIMQSRYTEAVAMLEEAQLVFQALGEPLGAAQCTQSMGNVLRRQSRCAEAVPMLEEAKLAFQAIGEPLGAVQCMQSLGDILRMQSRDAEAVPILEEAKLAFEAIGDPLGAAWCRLVHSMPGPHPVEPR
ncbi:TPR-like protein [Calocera viscosa TUFC12733]|uniref:TPR-like protein n=1 Tax=Calocera viscosa (strain TUFC12733) TaxID=1330018 RepID=A0A167HDY9_CALVF|nr:TPR-like protein [Calocera viscosa TUFC12733]